MNGVIYSFLNGETTVAELHEFITKDASTIIELNKLIPDDAIKNVNHPIWSHYSFEALNDASFELSRYLLSAFKFDNSIGDNLNIFSTIKYFALYNNPGIRYTMRYIDSFDLYLSITKDCFEGSEVRVVINKVIDEAMNKKTKAERKKYSQEQIKNLFHVDGNKRPKWIHGPDWPMGHRSPMKFIYEKQIKEGFAYFFQDVDEGQIRVVTQFY